MILQRNELWTPGNGRQFLALPSTEKGVFLVDHGDYYGIRHYFDMELHVPKNEQEAAMDGDFSASYSRLNPHPVDPGLFTPASWMLHVEVTLPGSGNTVNHNVDAVREMTPFDAFREVKV